MKLKPEVGWRRISADFIDLSLIILPTIYTTILVAAILKTPLLSSRGLTSSLNSFGLFFTILLFVEILYIITARKVFRGSIGKAINGLTIVLNKKEIPPTRKKLILRNLIVLTLFILLSFLSTWAFIGFWLVIFGAISAIANTNPTFIKLVSDQIITFPPKGPFLFLLGTGTTFLYFILYYFSFVRLWKKRGIPDLIAGTKVINIHSGWKTKKILILDVSIIFLYFLITPVASYFEKNIPYTNPHPFTVIQTNNLIEYKNSESWSIKYPNQFVVGTTRSVSDSFKKMNTAPFSINSDLVAPCISSFSLSQYKYFDTSKSPISQFIMIDQTKSGVFGFDLTNNQPISINGYSGFKLVYEDKKPLASGTNFSWRIIKKVDYVIDTKQAVYGFYYEIPELVGYPYKFSPQECQQNEEAMNTIFNTLQVSK